MATNNNKPFPISLFASNEFLTFGLATLAFFFATFRVGQESFFIDEVTTYLTVNGSLFSQLLTVDANPPLYFILLKFWATIFGTSHEALRMFSVCTATISVIVMHRITMLLDLDKISGVSAALWFLCNPMLIWYGQQARPYSMLVLMVLLWMYSVISFTSFGAHKTFVTLWTFIGISTHYYFVFFIIGIMIPLSLTLYLSENRKKLFPLCIGIAVGFLAYLIHLPLILKQLKFYIWSATPQWSELNYIFLNLFFSGPWNNESFSALPGLLIFNAIFIVSLFKSFRTWKSRDSKTLTADLKSFWGIIFFTGCFLTVAIPIFISRLEFFNPIYAIRYTIIAFPMFLLAPFAMSNSIFSRNTARKFIGICVLLVGLVAAIPGTINYWSNHQEFDWRKGASIVESEWQKGDSIVFTPDWLVRSFENNGGKVIKKVLIKDLFLNSEIKPEVKRIWLFTWEQNPDRDEMKLNSYLRSQPGSKERVHFPHKTLWEVKLSGASSRGIFTPAP